MFNHDFFLVNSNEKLSSFVFHLKLKCHSRKNIIFAFFLDAADFKMKRIFIIQNFDFSWL